MSNHAEDAWSDGEAKTKINRHPINPTGMSKKNFNYRGNGREEKEGLILHGKFFCIPGLGERNNTAEARGNKRIKLTLGRLWRNEDENGKSWV